MLSKQLQKQIEQEAKAGQHTYPGTDYGYGFNKGYDSGYKFAGEKYAALYETAVARAERAEKLIEQLNNQSFIKGVPGATWGDTEYDSMASAAGYNQAIMNMKTLLVNALTPKTGEDELHKEP